MKLKILVVEDKKALNKNIVDILTLEGYSAQGVNDYDSAVSIFNELQFDIVILDIMLPGGEGHDLIELFRKSGSTRILMLTAITDRDMKKICYDKGADDYITKPFDLEELVFKISAIKRRMISDNINLRVGDIFLNRDTYELCSSKSMILSHGLVELLAKLCNNYMSNPSDPPIYSVLEMDKRRIQTAITRLRKSLEYIDSKSVSIRTVYGQGYVIEVYEG